MSPNSYGISVTDAAFRDALRETDFLVLDGVYFALASIFLQGKNITKNQGPEVFDHFVHRLNETSGKAFFLGSSEMVLKKIRERARKEFPHISIGTFSPPFKKQFSWEDNELMVRKVNEFKPDILFVGMTAPKQEKWAIQHRELLNTGLVISIGNVFDWYAGTQKIIHPIWYKLRLAWFIRIFQRPEIFSRNIGNQMLFFWHLLLVMLRVKEHPSYD